MANEQHLQCENPGFHYLELKRHSKEPAHIGWQDRTTRDAHEAADWFARGSNVGIYAGAFADDAALLILDSDVKGAADGNVSLHQLELDGYPLPKTREHATPSGGRHLFFKVPAPVKQSVGKIAPGIDVRSLGGFVVAPGSKLPNGVYTVSHPRPIADAPAWLVAACGRPAAAKKEKLSTPSNVDPIAAAARAARYLQQDAPLAVEGQGGDSTTYAVACRVRDFGTDQATTLSLMLEHWNERCAPPWDRDSLSEKVGNAYRYGENPPGVSAPEADFAPVPTGTHEQPSEKAANNTRRPRLHYELFQNIAPDLAKPALVEGLLDTAAMSVLYGESNSGKSFIALDLSFAIATGGAWHGRQVERGTVVFVAAEGGGHIRKRIAALRIHHKLGASIIPLAIVPCPIDLSGEGADVAELVSLIARAAGETGAPVRMVVVDTLARAIGGANENAPDDMGAFVRNVDKVRNASDSHLLIVHHTGKDRARGARGHSSLRAATDTELEVADGTITVTKQRDMDAGPPIGFRLQPVEIGTDGRGRMVTSCVVVSRSAHGAEDFRAKPLKPGSSAARALDILRDTIRAEGIAAPKVLDLPQDSKVIRVSQWRDACGQRLSAGKADAQERAFRRVGETLFGGHVEKHNDFVWLPRG